MTYKEAIEKLRLIQQLAPNDSWSIGVNTYAGGPGCPEHTIISGHSSR